VAAAPAFAPSKGRWGSMMTALRRFLDLQAGSIWRDLKILLPHVTATIVDVGCGSRLFLEEAFPCLAPGGTILITVPFALHWHSIPHDYWRYTPSGLSYWLRNAGFVITHARGNAFTVACYKVMALRGRPALPQTQTIRVRRSLQILFLAFLPAFLLIAMLSNWSLLARCGDDCIGYTAMSERRSS
jgi:hypothetical protein